MTCAFLLRLPESTEPRRISILQFRRSKRGMNETTIPSVATRTTTAGTMVYGGGGNVGVVSAMRASMDRHVVCRASSEPPGRQHRVREQAKLPAVGRTMTDMTSVGIRSDHSATSRGRCCLLRRGEALGPLSPHRGGCRTDCTSALLAV